MKCNKAYQYIANDISFAEIEEHLKECKICSNRLEHIDQLMSVLDEQTEVPDGLVEKTLLRKKQEKLPPKPGIDYSKYLQIAAVLVAGIILGAFLGRNANPQRLFSKKMKKDQALIEYSESHHLNESSSLFRF